jgi:argininosuccinate lyase
MLKAAQVRLDADKAWLTEQRSKLAKADAALDKAFATLLPAEKVQ